MAHLGGPFWSICSWFPAQAASSAALDRPFSALLPRQAICRYVIGYPGEVRSAGVRSIIAIRCAGDGKLLTDEPASSITPYRSITARSQISSPRTGRGCRRTLLHMDRSPVKHSSLWFCSSRRRTKVSAISSTTSESASK